MAELRYDITGSVTGLNSAANAATGILKNLQNTANNLKISLFNATTESDLNAIGGALTIVTGKIKDYTSAAIQGSQAFKDQQGQAAIDALNTKLTVLNGNARLFGQSISNSNGQIRAYQSTIDALLKNGFDPLDSRVQSFKNSIDSLTKSVEAQKQAAKGIADPYSQFRTTGSLILDAENKVKNLENSLRKATNTRDIAQYNVRLAEANAQLTALRNTGIRAAESQTRLADASRRVGSNFNSVGVEFGRIIQDAPYAANNFGAIGNNITRLVEVLPSYIAQTRATIVAQGGVATSANVMRGALAGVFSGFGAISLAISALVAAYTIISMRQKKTSDDLDENSESAKKTTESFAKLKAQIQSVSETRLDGILGGASDLAKLQQLYSASQNLNIPLKDRKRIVDELQAQYPTTFKNVSDESILAGKAAGAYEKLNAALINKAIIQANTENLANAIKPLLRMQEVASQTEKQIKAAQKVLSDPFAGFSVKQKAQDDLKRLNLGDSLFAGFNKNAKQALKDTIQGILDAGNELIAEFGSGIIIDDKGGKATQQRLNSIGDRLAAILTQTKEIAGQSGLESYALQVQKVIDKYSKLNSEVDSLLEKNRKEFKAGNIDQSTFTANQKSGLTDKQSIANAQYIELINGEIKERQRAVDEIQRINDRFGIKTQDGREKELAQIKAFYDREVVLARGNKEILAVLDAGRPIAEQAIKDKYINKAVEDFNNLFINAQKKIDKGAEKAENQLSSVLSRSLRNFGQNFVETLSNAETYSKGTFTSIFADLTGKLTSALNKVFLDVVLDGLSKALTSAISNGTSALFKDGKITGLGGAIAGAGVLGSVLSAATPATSTVGQAAGGALSGAAAGAAIGSVVPVIGTVAGAVVGGVIGAIGGIFGSSDARKREEELQRQQLEEAKKQTELLRQAQAAYTSQIIGRMTANGTITGINVGSTGQLVATVSGNQLQFILDRNNNGR